MPLLLPPCHADADFSILFLFAFLSPLFSFASFFDFAAAVYCCLCRCCRMPLPLSPSLIFCLFRFSPLSFAIDYFLSPCCFSIVVSRCCCLHAVAISLFAMLLLLRTLLISFFSFRFSSLFAAAFRLPCFRCHCILYFRR